MKKIIISIVILVLFIAWGVLISRKPDNKIKVAEVTHSVFYAPQYVAHALGYFSDEGLDVEILLTPGADKVAAAVLSGDADIGLCGSEATIYIYNQGEKDYLVSFAGLTKRDGSFLVSREKIDSFDISMLKDKHIIGGRKGGMPAMTLKWALNQNGFENPNIDTSIEFAAMSGAFIGGSGDFVTLFEPNATKIEQQGYGYIVSSVGELGGVVPYTAYNARKSFIENNKNKIASFSSAIQKGLDYVHSHSEEEIAKTILSYFPDTSLNDLTLMIKRHKDIDSWYTSTEIKEKDFNHIQDIMENAGELANRVNYKDLVYSK